MLNYNVKLLEYNPIGPHTKLTYPPHYLQYLSSWALWVHVALREMGTCQTGEGESGERVERKGMISGEDEGRRMRVGGEER